MYYIVALSNSMQITNLTRLPYTNWSKMGIWGAGCNNNNNKYDVMLLASSSSDKKMAQCGKKMAYDTLYSISLPYFTPEHSLR